MSESLWNADQLAEHLGCSPATVVRQASQDPTRLPPRVRSLRLLRWDPTIVREWVTEQSRTADRPRQGRRRKT